MEDFLKDALEIVKAQAAARQMTSEEITSMVASVSAGIKAVASGDTAPAPDNSGAPAGDGKKSIKERSIVCLECGKAFKVLTKKHLVTHGLTPAEYREKHGLKKGAALTCKSLARERRAKMKDMKLWERRGKKGDTAAAVQ